MDLNVIIYEPVVSFQSTLINFFFHAGLNVKLIKKKWEIEPVVLAAKPCVLLCTLLQDDQELLSIAAKINQNEEFKEIKVILQLDGLNKQFLASLKKLAFNKLMLKTRDHRNFLKQFLQLSDIDLSKISSRKQIRVQPEANDNARVMMRLPGDTKIGTGQILNVSLGGFLFQLEHIESIVKLYPDLVLSEVHVLIREMKLSASVIVVAVKKPVIAVKFLKMVDYERNSLSMYIYKMMEVEFDKMYLTKASTGEIKADEEEVVDEDKEVVGTRLDQQGNVIKEG